MGKDDQPVGRIGGLLAFVALFSIAVNLLMLTGPLFMLQIYDRVLATRSEETLAALAILAAGLFALYGVLEFARARVLAGLSERKTSKVAETLFRGALGHTQGATAPQAWGDVRAAGQPHVVLPYFDVPFVPLFLGAIFLFHPLLGFLATGGAGVLGILALANRALSRTPLERANAGDMRAARHWAAALQDAGYARAQGMGGALASRWRGLAARGQEDRDIAEGWSLSMASAAKALRFGLQSGILALGALLVLRGQMTAGAMVAASILFGRALQPVEQMIAGWPVAQKGRAAWRIIRQLVEAAGDEGPSMELPAPKGALSLAGVSVVTGAGEEPLLQGLSAEIEAGTALGVIGKSGAGKSTLARLLVGALAPTLGEVRLDGALFDQYGSSARAQVIGYLPQDVRFFDGTVAENIARMAADVDAAAVVLAAEQAGVHGVIQRLPDGYDTHLQPGSAVLSGGARQRLALARALYGGPSILVLDEPNAALDAEGQDALNRVIAQMKAAGKTSIVMTHRPGAIAACDRLMVLDRGRLRADGPRDKVLAAVASNAQDIQRTLGAIA
ncbi:MAG: type I secretion system permease/ATPase [Pseudomonadota bacterium]